VEPHCRSAPRASTPSSEFNGGRARVENALGQVLPHARRLRRPIGLSPLLAPYELVVTEKPS